MFCVPVHVSHRSSDGYRQTGALGSSSYETNPNPNVHGVDITHDNVCSAMLSCFFSYVAATVNRASYL